MREYELFCGVAMCARAINSVAPVAAVAADTGTNDGNTTTPIKHIITITGENRTFDQLFATYRPVKTGETVLNLLSEKIIDATARRVPIMPPSHKTRRWIW
jgi:phospholipase C